MAESNENGPSTASLFERALAFMIDGLIVLAALGAFFLWLGPTEEQSKTEVALGFSAYAFFFLYHGVLNAYPGWTPGKWVAGIRVEKASDGSRLTLGRSLARSLGYFLDALTLGFGFLLILFNKQRRGGHDFVAGTRVVRLREKGPLGKWLVGAGACLLFLLTVGLSVFRTLRGAALNDRQAVATAHEALSELGTLEERRKKAAGRYSDSLIELAEQAEIPSDVHQNLPKMVLENSLVITVTPGGYRITARARDSEHTAVTLEGPPSSDGRGSRDQ